MGTALFVLLMVVVLIVLSVAERVLDVNMRIMLHNEEKSNTIGDESVVEDHGKGE